MADVKQEALNQLDKLIEEGKRCDDSFHLAGMGTYESNLPEGELRTFTVKAFTAVERIAGRESEYYRLLPPNESNTRLGVPGYVLYFIPAINGCLTALREAVNHDLLVSLESRLRANVHDDILQQAKSLLEQQHHVAAMVLVGGVLEDHLNKLCTKHGLTWNGSGSISKYNEACHKAAIYDKPIWRRIQSIGDSRNDAAHGHGAKVKAPDVEDAHKFTERFIADHPA